MNGVTHTVQLHASLTGPIVTERGVHCAGLQASGRISRAAYGLRPPRDPHTAALPDADIVYVDIELENNHREITPGSGWALVGA